MFPPPRKKSRGSRNRTVLAGSAFSSWTDPVTLRGSCLACMTSWPCLTTRTPDSVNATHSCPVSPSRPRRRVPRIPFAFPKHIFCDRASPTNREDRRTPCPRLPWLHGRVRSTHMAGITRYPHNGASVPASQMGHYRLHPHHPAVPGSLATVRQPSEVQVQARQQ